MAVAIYCLLYFYSLDRTLVKKATQNVREMSPIVKVALIKGFVVKTISVI